MAIIVAGHLRLRSGSRNAFINQSREAVSKARALKACEDFAVSPDPLDENRVNIFEKWTSRESLDSFRSSGPDNDAFALVESFDIHEHEVN